MNILDENFPEEQRKLLERKRVRVCKIGRDMGRKGMGDEDILSLMHSLDRPTLFTQDDDFFARRLCHRGYCVVQLKINPDLLARYVRRILRHRKFNTKAKRMGSIVEVKPRVISVWHVNRKKLDVFEWD